MSKKKVNYKWTLRQYNEISPALKRVVDSVDLEQAFAVETGSDGQQLRLNINGKMILDVVLGLSEELTTILSATLGMEEEEVLDMDFEKATTMLGKIAEANKPALTNFLNAMGVGE